MSDYTPSSEELDIAANYVLSAMYMALHTRREQRHLGSEFLKRRARIMAQKILVAISDIQDGVPVAAYLGSREDGAEKNL